jgi:hypothetical protein
MPKPRSANPTQPATQPKPVDSGEKVVSLRIPVALATWALRQARLEGTTRTARIVEFLEQWQASVAAETAEAGKRHEAEIQAAVAAALRADRRRRGGRARQ